MPFEGGDTICERRAMASEAEGRYARQRTQVKLFEGRYDMREKGSGKRDIGYPCQVCLLSRSSLLPTCVGCLEIEHCSLILTARWKTERGLDASPRTPCSRLRYASQANTNMHPGGCRPFKVIQGNTITPMNESSKIRGTNTTASGS